MHCIEIIIIVSLCVFLVCIGGSSCILKPKIGAKSRSLVHTHSSHSDCVLGMTTMLESSLALCFCLLRGLLRSTAVAAAPSLSH